MQQEEVQQVQTVVPEGTSLLMHGVPSQLQFKFKLLLVSLVGDKQPYYHDRVRKMCCHCPGHPLVRCVWVVDVH